MANNTEQKTKVFAEEGRQYLTITREFDLPVELVFKAYAEAEFLEQWMGTKVLKMESRKHGSYQYETRDANGKVVFKANGVIHEFEPNQKITKTFEMENANFGVQLDFLEFEKLTAETSKLHIYSVYKTVALRDELLKLPFAWGLNIAHNRLQTIADKFK